MLEKLLIWLLAFVQRKNEHRNPSRGPAQTDVPSEVQEAKAAVKAKPVEPVATEPPPPPASVYLPRAFDCAAIREEALSTLGPEISTEQQALVFSEAGAQSVAAGAGSGKSSTLAKRLLVMRHMLKVPFNEISVFTFTKNSRIDFIEKVLETAEAMGVQLTERQAQERVKTFHSKLIQLSRPFQSEGMMLFEFLGKKALPKPGSPEENELTETLEMLANEEDNPYDRRPSAQQLEVLRTSYERAYANDERFRQAIGTLLKSSFRNSIFTKGSVEKDFSKRRVASERDEALTDWITEYWRKRSLWPIEGVSSEPPRKLMVDEYSFFANGYIPEVDTFVVLGVDAYKYKSKEEVTHKGSIFFPLRASDSKNNLLLTKCNAAIYFARTEVEVENLVALIEAQKMHLNARPPIFNCRLPGEGGRGESIASALYQFGSFMENIGLKPAASLGNVLPRVTSTLDKLALYAVCKFFAYFDEVKDEDDLQTFNDLFFQLQEGSPSLAKMPLTLLRSMKHLLIDEFQDISPLIVGMVKALHGELVRRTNGAEHPTLLVVGDDWQSIYGWRGSAPKFFLEFASLFDGANRSPVLLGDNYRSSQNIVSCALTVLGDISPKNKMHKKCAAKNPNVAQLPYPVFMLDSMKNDEVQRVLESLVQATRARGLNESIMVVARKGSDVNIAEGFAKAFRAPNVSAMTVHGSKGLQADFVLVLDDFSYQGSSALRNALYAETSFPQTYDDSQRDESRRVAYVALTRAKKLCIWMARPKEGGASSLVPYGQNFVQQADIELLLKAVEVIGSP